MRSLFPSPAEEVGDLCERIAALLPSLPLVERVDALNRVVAAAHAAGPFAAQPVGCPQWVPAELVHSNDYNPNAVAPPEMRLLQLSIEADGYTQPVVTMPDGDRREVVDGFHRKRIGTEVPAVREACHGYLPTVTIRAGRSAREDRMAATVRHNRARGKHGVEAMTAMVRELAQKGWTSERIGKELGMDADEVLRLRQLTGLAELFRDREFSEAWDARPKRKKKPKEGDPK